MMRKGLRALALASGAALLLIGGAGQANAHTQATWLSCVVKVGGKNGGLTPVVTVQNKCAWTYTVKVVWDYGADSLCTTLSVGEMYTHTSTPGASYRGVQIC